MKKEILFLMFLLTSGINIVSAQGNNETWKVDKVVPRWKVDLHDSDYINERTNVRGLCLEQEITLADSFIIFYSKNKTSFNCFGFVDSTKILGVRDVYIENEYDDLRIMYKAIGDEVLSEGIIGGDLTGLLGYSGDELKVTIYVLDYELVKGERSNMILISGVNCMGLVTENFLYILTQSSSPNEE